MSEEPSEKKSACPHPEAVGTRWGDPITPERQAELQAILDARIAPSADQGKRKGPFDGVKLTSVSWPGACNARECQEPLATLVTYPPVTLAASCRANACSSELATGSPR